MGRIYQQTYIDTYAKIAQAKLAWSEQIRKLTDDLHERAAMREDSGAARTDTDNAAFDELLWLWCAANPVEHAPGQCAACGTTLGPPIMALPDGAQVCDRPDHACLIAQGNGRRMVAAQVLEGMGIAPPMWWEL